MSSSQPSDVDASLNPRSYSDLDGAQRVLLNPLIFRLAHVNRSRESPSALLREHFWARVFRNWDPSRPCRKPEPLPARSMSDSSIPVGTLKQDVPDPRHRKRTSDGAQVVPDHRRAGATIWLRPQLNWEEKNIQMNFVDKNNSVISQSLVRLDSHYTDVTAMVEAMNNYDQNEMSRLGRWNREVVIYWSRVYLIEHQRWMKEEGGPGADAIRVVAAKDMPDTNTVGNQDELLEIRCCRDVLDHCVRMATSLKEGTSTFVLRAITSYGTD